MTRDFLYDYMRQHRFAVLSTVSAQNTPESAYVGIAVTRELNIVFDTVSDSRKYHNLQANPHIAFVIGGDQERTLQYEGIATVPSAQQLDLLLHIYFEAFPDGKFRKENWPRIAYFCVQPRWIRYADFGASPNQIEEINF
jgi:general stress protein 26